MKGLFRGDRGAALFLSLVCAISLFAGYGYAATSETGTTSIEANVNVFVDIVPSSGLASGINFGNVDPNTIGNPAENNTDCGGGTCYNISVDAASNVDVDFFHDLQGSLGAGLDVNETASTTAADSGFSTNTTITTSYTIVGNTTDNCTVISGGSTCWVKYYLDVAAGTTGGAKSNTYEYCGVQTGEGSGACT